MADIGFPNDAVERGWFTRDAAGNVTLSDQFYGDVHAIASQDMFWPNSTLAYSNALRSLGFTGDVSTPTQAVDMIPLVIDNGTPNPNTQWVRDMLTVTLAGGNAPVSPVADPAAAQNLQAQLTQTYGERLAAPAEATPAVTNTGFFAPDAVERGWVATGTDGVALTDQFYSDLDAALRAPAMAATVGRPAALSVAMQNMGVPQEFAQNFFNNLDLARSEGHFDMAAIRPQLERAMVGAGVLTVDAQIPALQANFTARLTAQFGAQLPAVVPEAMVAADTTVTPTDATPADTVTGGATPVVVTNTLTPVPVTDTATPVAADEATPVRADTLAAATLTPTLVTPTVITPTVINPTVINPTVINPVAADAIAAAPVDATVADAVPVETVQAVPVENVVRPVTADTTILPGDASKDGTLASRILSTIGSTIISPAAAATLPGGSLVGADTLVGVTVAADTLAGADTVAGAAVPGRLVGQDTVPGSLPLVHTNPGDPSRDITFTQDAWDYRMQLVREEAARAGDPTAIGPTPIDPAQMAEEARQDTLQVRREMVERQRVIDSYTQYGELRRQGEALANSTVPGAGVTPVDVTPAGVTPVGVTAGTVTTPVTTPVVSGEIAMRPEELTSPVLTSGQPVTAAVTATAPGTAATPVTDTRTNTERALATLMAMDRSGMSEDRMEAAMLREAGLYVNLLAPTGRKYSGAALQEQIEALQPGQLVGVTLMGSGRAAVMQLLASTPARTADGTSLRDLSIDASMAALYTPDARGLMDAHTQSVRDALERVATRTGHGTRWLETMVGNTNRTITQNLADRGIEANTGMSAAAIHAQFDAKVAAHTAVAAPVVTPAVTSGIPLLTSDATGVLPGQTNPALRAALPIV